MTQIIGVLTRKCVFQVSDRLLSQSDGKSTVGFDRNSNKSVVFHATDGHLVAAYTGHAYIDGIPTDTFIAQSLLGLILSDRGAFVRIGNPSSWTDIGRSVDRLRENLSAAFERMPEEDRDNGDFCVSLLGWRQRRGRNKRITPVVLAVRRPSSGSQQFQINRHQRWWRWDGGFSVTAIPSLESNPILEWMRNELREYGGISPDEVRRIIVEGIKRCSDQRPQRIGRSCLQITLTPAAPHARIRYILDTRSPDDLIPDGTGYSPWIVAPPWVFAPAIIRGEGGFINSATGYQWVLEGVVPPPGTPQYSQSRQPRRSDPRTEH